MLMSGIAAVLCLSAAPAARAGTTNQTNPSVVFTTAGTKQVMLTACNPLGTCDSKTLSVEVLDPMPAVTGATALVVPAEVGQLVKLMGSGTGKPPLSFNWQVAPPAAPSFGFSGNTAWWDTTGLPPGLYTASLSISNSAGSAVSLPVSVVLQTAQATDYYTVNPCRVFDSRSGAALASGSNTVVNLAVAACGIPASARAVAGNLTVVNPDGEGYVSLYPGNYPQPSTSTANFVSGAVRGNSVVMPMATDGSGTLGLSVFVGNNGSAHVVLDVTGYFQTSP
jgi:PKD repeat protein